MARLRRVTAAAINISMPTPHSPQRYAELIEAIFRLKQPVRVRGDQHIILSSVSSPDDDGVFIEGVLARFTVVDKDLPWFDINRLDQADDEDQLSIVIPENLRPNYKPFSFYFNLNSHMFVFEQAYGSKSISVQSVQRFLTESVLHEEISAKFGTVSVSILQREDALDAIFGLTNIRWIRILYRIPNADDQSHLEKVMQERLQSLHASQVDMTFDADARAGLNPSDEQVRTLAASALRNGLVEARGTNDAQQVVKASSEEHPKLASERFDPTAISETHILRRLARFLS